MKHRKSQQTLVASAGKLCLYSLAAILAVGCSSSDHQAADPQLNPPADEEDGSQDDNAPPSGVQRVVLQGTDLNNIGSPLLSLNPDGPGGSPNQSLRSGDILQSGPEDTTIIGALGVDVIVGDIGDDVMIGGTEDFNTSVDSDGRGSDNRDRAFGGQGNDIFIWTPGDGSDFYDGGPGIDVIAFGIVGELQDNEGSQVGAPFFNVSPPGTTGSQNFDGIFLDPNTNLPTLSVSTSPGFCTVLDDSTNPAELATLSLDHLIRFSLRGVANAFDAGERTDDDGLRVALSLRNVEYVACTTREFVDGAGIDNVEVLDITSTPPRRVALSDLPPVAQQVIR